MKNKKLLFLLVLLVSNLTFANIVLPNIFSDNMVLQRNSEVLIWGFANPQEEGFTLRSFYFFFKNKKDFHYNPSR